MEIKTEADSDDMTESQRDEQPSTSMFFLLYCPGILLSCIFVAVLYEYMSLS